MSGPISKKDTRLVYSTDPALNKRCEKCRELVSECVCEPDIGVDAAKASKYVAVLRLETAGRKGKTVTVIDGLPKQEIFLRELTTMLKKKCGAGGTYLMDKKEGVIEIQGDKREAVRAHFAKTGVRTKG